MLKKEVVKLLNEQVNAEMYSAYLYLDFSNYFNNIGLDGFANWYSIQAKEEMDHAMMFYNYLHDGDEEVVLDAIAKPERNWKDAIGILKEALKHEIYVTSLIDKLYEEAEKLKDFRTCQYLHWFIEEQAEEEVNAKDLITKYELFGSDPNSLYALNNELKARVYNPPAKSAE
ncbi:MAG: ferritin [Peptostreptococcaceae bacterium]|nr:ferritin [Peptostreptococcaceae bacterium]MDY5739810.1 ferritin [Anaerovoracaceae bacterium]SFE50679.1 ferritin [Peptostreptococcaceae bacterium pGA-8]